MADPAISINQIGDGNLSAKEDNPVTITGRVDGLPAGGVVTVEVTDLVKTVSATAVVQADGSWSVSGLNLSGLLEGNLAVTASIVDQQDRRIFAESEVGHDRSPPTVSIEPIGDANISATEGQATVISGSTQAEPGQVVTVTVSDGTKQVTGTAIVGANRKWSTAALDLSTLAAGDLSVKADVEDKAGNAGSAVKSVLYDPNAPKILINKIGSGSLSASEDDSVSIGGTTEGAEFGQKVTIRVGDGVSSVTATATVGADGTWVATGVNLAGLQDGSLQVAATVADLAGNLATANSTVEHDATPPGIEITTPITADGVLNSVEDDSFSVSGTTEGAPPGSIVTVTVTDLISTVTGTAIVQADGTWTVTGLNVSGLLEGILSVQATVTDAVGNRGFADASVGHDKTLPTITIDPFADDKLAAGQDDSVTVSGSTKLVEPGQIVTITIDDNDPTTPAVTASTTVGAGGVWSISGLNLSSLNDGQLTVTADVSDKAGNPAPQAKATLTHDTVPPVIAITSGNTNDPTPVIAGTTDAEEGQIVTVVVDPDNDPSTPNSVTYTTTVQPGGVWSINTETDAPASGTFPAAGLNGPAKVTASVDDAAGNPSVPATKVIIVDVTKPEIAIDRPIGDGALSAGEDDSVTISGTTTAEPSQVVTVTITDPANKSITVTTTVNADGTWSIKGVDLSSLGEGTLTVKADVTNKAGNSGSDDVRVEHDTVPPTIEITTPSETSNPFPVIAGKTVGAEPGQVVTVTIDPDNDPNTPNDVVFTTTVRPDGTWSIDTKADEPARGSLPPDGLKGPAGVTADVTDVAGNPAVPAEQPLTVKTTGPKLAIDRPVGDGALSDSEDNAVTIAGTTTAEPGQIVTVSIDDNDGSTAPVIGSAVVGADGTWKIEGLNLSSLKDGTLTVKADVKDKAGNSATDSTPVAHDTIAPVIAITSPADTGNPTPQISGTTDAEPGQVVTVTIDPDNDPTTPNVEFTTTVRPDGTWTVDTATDTPTSGTLPPGGLTGPAKITATVEDVAGNPSLPANQTLVLDPTAPTIKIDRPVGDGDLSITEDRNVTVSGTTTAEAGQVVTVTIDDADPKTAPVVGSAVVGPDGKWTVTGLDLVLLDDGTLDVKATVTNQAGKPASDTTQVKHDTILPEILIDRPIGDGALSASEDDAVTISGTTTAEPGQVVTITVTDGTTTVTATAVVAPNGTWTAAGVNLSGLKDGPLDVKASVTDKAGNPGSDDASVTHDSVPPTISITSPDKTSNPNPEITGKTDAEPGQVVTVTIDPDNDPSTPNDVVYTTTVNPDGTWSVDTKTDTPTEGSLPPDGLKGPAKVTAEVSDIAGNPATPAEKPLTVDTTGPKLAIDRPIGDGDLSGTEDNAVTVTGTTTAEPGRIVTVKINDSDNDPTKEITGSAVVGADGKWTVTGLDLSSLKDGPLSVKADVTNVAGQPATDTASVNHDATAPVIDITTGPTGDKTPVIEGTTDAEPGQPVTVTIDPDNNPATDNNVVFTTTVKPDGTWSVDTEKDTPASGTMPPAGLPDGPIPVKAEVTDKAGNPGSKEEPITIDSTLPTITINEPIGDGDLSASEDRSVTISGVTTKVEAGRIVTLTIDDQDPSTPAVTASALVGADGKWSVSGLDLHNLRDGSLDVKAEVSDAAGKKVSDTASVNHDTVLPEILIDRPIGDGALSASEDDAVTIKGTTTAEPGEVVAITVTDGTTSVTASAIVQPDGTWKVDGVDLSKLKDGPLDVKAEVADKAGNKASDTTPVEHDKTAPTISITSPDKTSNPNPEITGKTDAEPGQVVTVTIDPDNDPSTPNDVVYTTTVNPDGTWSVDTKTDTPTEGSLPPDGLKGPAKVTAEVSDIAGNPATPAEKPLTVDTTGPKLAIDRPIGDGDLSGTEDNAVTVTGTTTAEPGRIVTVKINDSDNDPTKEITGSAVVGADGKWTVTGLDLSSLKDGPLSVKADVTNVAGQPATDTASVNHDATAPVIDITTGPTGDKTPVIEGTTDAEPGQPVTVTIDPDNNPATDNNVVFTTTVKPDGTWSVDTEKDTPASGTMPPAGLPDGPIPVKAEVTDKAGNPGSKEEPITIDSTLPTITINEPIGDGDLSASEDRSVTISGVTTKVEAGRIVTLTIDDQDPSTPAVTASALVGADGKWSVSGLDLHNLRDGSLDVKAEVSDAAGKKVSDTASVNHDTVLPEILIDRPIGDGALSASEDDAVTIKGTTTAEPGEVVAITVTDGTTSVTASAIVQPDGTWKVDGVDLSKLKDGPLDVKAEVADKAGNKASDTTPVEHDKTAPTISITSPDKTSNPNPEITGKTDAEPGQVVTVTIDPDNDPSTPNDVVYTTTVNPDGTWSVDTKTDTPTEGSLPPDGLKGPAKVTAEVSDIAGNPATPAEKPLTVDTTGPKLAIDRPIGDGDLSASEDDKVDIKGTTTAEPGRVVTVTVDDSDSTTAPITGSAVVGPDGKWTVTGLNLSSLKDGPLSVKADVTNVANQPATDTASVNHDATAPVIDITTGATGDKTPVIEGTTDAPPGQPVTVTIDPDNNPATPNDVVYTTTVKPDGTWSIDTGKDTPKSGTFPPAGLPDGPIPVKAEVTDKAGNPATDNGTVTVDSTLPTILVDEPIGDGDLSPSEDRVVTISGKTTLVEAGQVVSVTVNDDDPTTPEVKGSAVVGADGSWKLVGVDLHNLRDGILNVKAEVTNQAGKKATDTATVNHDTVLPEIKIDRPIGDGELSALEDKAVTISGTTTAEPEQVVSVVVTDGTTSITASAVVQPDGTWKVTGLDLSPLKDGPLDVKAEVADKAGNRADDITPVIHDKTAPVIEITTTGPTGDKTPVIEGTTDAEPGQKVTVTLPDPDNDPSTPPVVYTTTVKPDGTWRIDTGVETPTSGEFPKDGLPDGPVTVKADVSDRAENPASTTKDIPIDSTLPTIEINEPIEDGALSAAEDNDVSITGKTSAEAGQVVTVTVDDDDPTTPAVTGTGQVQPDGTWAVDGLDLSGLKDGPLNVKADVSNLAGKPASDTASVPHDTVPPTIEITTPGTVGDKTPVIEGKTDAEPDQVVTVTIDPDNDPATAPVTYTTTVRPDGTWSVDTENDKPAAGTFPTGGLPNGTFPVTADVSDVAGNPASQAKKDLAVDDTFPVIVINEPIGDGLLSVDEDRNVTISGTTTAEAGQKVTVTVTDGVKTVTGVAEVKPDKTWSISGLDLHELKDGLLDVRADVKNQAGKPATDNAKVVHDTIPPAIVIEEPIGDGNLSASEDDAVTIKGTTTAEPDQKVVVTVSDGTSSVLATATVKPDGTWQVDGLDLSGLKSGPLKVTADVADKAGNRATDDASVIHSTGTLTILIDDQGQLPNGATPEITGTSNAPAGSVVTVTIDPDNSPATPDSVTYTTTVQADGKWKIDTGADVPVGGTFPIAGLTATSAGVVATVKDSAGNTATDDATLTIAPGGGNPTPVPMSIDLQTGSDTDTTGLPNATTDDVTADFTPTFDIVLPKQVEAGRPDIPGAFVNDVVKLYGTDSSGREVLIATGTVTAADIAAGKIALTSDPRSDGPLATRAELVAPDGTVRSTARLPITIVTDGDGIDPAVEEKAAAGDFNSDGVSDYLQSNVATFPMAGGDAFGQKVNAPIATFGSLIVGNPTPDGTGPVTLDPAAQLSAIGVEGLAALGSRLGVDLSGDIAEIPVDAVMNGVVSFNLAPKTGNAALADLDPTRDGIQTRVVLDVPAGVTADTFHRYNPNSTESGSRFEEYMADGDPETFDDGAEFILNSDGTVARVIVTYTASDSGNLQELGVLGAPRVCLDNGEPGLLLRATKGGSELQGGEGADTIRGGRGADVLHGDCGDDFIRGRGGRDLITGDQGNDNIRGNSGNDTILGGSGNDVISGGTQRDSIDGGTGDDTIRGGRGRDTEQGGAGNDNMRGGWGDDSLFGGGGNDKISGGHQRDRIEGGSGNDTIKGGHGRDTENGGTGDDNMRGGWGNDRVFGGLGNDSISGGHQRDFVDGGDGNDTVLGGRGRDTLIGGSGDDSMRGGTGVDEYRYLSESLGQGDLAAGSTDVIADVSSRNFIAFTDAVENALKIDGAVLSSLSGKVTLQGAIDSDNSIAFDRLSRSLLIDVNGDGSFDAASDMKIDLIGVKSVTLDAATGHFIMRGAASEAQADAVAAANRAQPKMGDLFSDNSPGVDSLLNNGVPNSANSAAASPGQGSASAANDSSSVIQNLGQLTKLHDDHALMS